MACRMPTKKLYITKASEPRKYTRKYASDSGRYFRRRPHQHQDLWRSQDAKDGQKDTADQTKSYGGMYRFFQILHVSGAKILSGHYACSDRDAIKKAHQEKDQVP